MHFSGQGVPDERPYQEIAAKQLGLSLHLITADGSTFPDDLFRLMYYQDQPVIGTAMFPMYSVSRLAAQHVKVCLGGQAADETFGGYARYALTRPLSVLRSWYAGRRSALEQSQPDTTSPVGGNLVHQLRDPRNLRRLLHSLDAVRDWQERYFSTWQKCLERCGPISLLRPSSSTGRSVEIFHETVRRAPAADPAGKAMQWDLQTYLTGLFQQDDRMSMAVSLESRVPFADPRLVRFAFETGSALKFRGGATKWILRQAVSDGLPAMVLNRRKVGFDTPVEFWIKQRHGDFVRDVLLSSRSRSRGICNARALAALIEQPDRPYWIDRVWKLLAIETWASVFLDDVQRFESCDANRIAIRTEFVRDPKGLPPAGTRPPHYVTDAVQEVRELGLRGLAARASWELKKRSGLAALAESTARGRQEYASGPAQGSSEAVPVLFGHPVDVREAVFSRLSSHAIARLSEQAREATKGNIVSFGRWIADYGNPIDWHRNPHNGRRWPSDRHWSQALASERTAGDVKLVWEVARFPHAFVAGRLASVRPDLAPELYAAFARDVQGFLTANPYGKGVHWNSGQEVAIRCLAWVFGLNVFSRLGLSTTDLETDVLVHMRQAGGHIYRHLDFARQCVNNNHLISEAFGLYLAGSASDDEEARRWRDTGRQILSEEAERQFYPDGAYLQLSHNYHRAVLQLYLCAVALARQTRTDPDPAWTAAMERSLDFLVAHQNPLDGRLPNSGANDGAMPCVLSSCDFADFRPLLQAVSVSVRGERLYEQGPWDEETAWVCGPAAVQAPLRRPRRRSIAFRSTGYHVLRARGDESSFATFRCGAIRDRYAQIDMLHLDVWWRGHNVLVDPGSYLYNGPEAWHEYFLSTASHNAVVVDHRDQMLPYRRFKNLYWTDAALGRFHFLVIRLEEHSSFQ